MNTVIALQVCSRRDWHFGICHTRNTTTCFEQWIYLRRQVAKGKKNLLCWAIYK